MNIESPVTVGGLIIASVFLLVVNFAPRLYDWLKLRAEMKERERVSAHDARLKALQAETEQDDKVWDRVIGEYERALERAARLENENDAIRPLALANAILEQKMAQCREDKEDWKAHAEALQEQLMSANIIPRPFRRLPRNSEDTQERLKTISRKMKTIKDSAVTERFVDGSPTLILPPVKGSDSEKE